ncbi:MAG: hypothetical protein OXF27_18475 [Acidobacteria bacterium]|nr:hypothetical protein [Acidobacteriota bacterium]
MLFLDMEPWDGALDAAGRKRWLMQADEVLYLHPDRIRLRGPALVVTRRCG